MAATIRFATMLFLAVAWQWGAVEAKAWYVNGSVGESGDGLVWETAFKTIQEGINGASDGDTVIVAQGTYLENIGFGGKNIALIGTNPLSPEVISRTVIDGTHTGSVVVFSGTENESCVLSGFTIRNGSAYCGGGICGGTESKRTLATIQNCTLVGNFAYWGGGGLAYCDGVILKNTISENTAECGGGMYSCDGLIEGNSISGNSATALWGDGGGMAFCDGTIRGNTINGNWAGDRGGGLANCGGVIERNSVTGNSAWQGGGLYRCDGTVRNSIILENTAEDVGGGLCRCDGSILNNTVYRNSAGNAGGAIWGCRGTVNNCIVWRNWGGDAISNSSVPTYSCIEDWTGGGTGNIAYYPYFVDAANGDFHLKRWSPCIDAGDPSSPFSEEPKPNGRRIDMGAYGNTSEATPGSPDIDKDGLPDKWELEFFGNLSQGKDDDPDKDLLSNIQEYHRGSDPSAPGTFLVDGSAVESGDGTLWETAFKTIQEGIAAATEGAVVVVAEGIYFENIHFHGKNITLTCTNPLDEEVVANTVIDGNGAGSVVTFDGTEDGTCALSGFTIRNGRAKWGAGICGGPWYAPAHATIQNNVITGNHAEEDSSGYGGGLAFCRGAIQENTISENTAILDGGGLYDCDGKIENNRISGNHANSGGGMYGCGVLVENNTISGNSAVEVGGGVAYCGAVIRGNVISGNVTLGKGPWWRPGGGGGLAHCGFVTVNNKIWGNSAADYGGGLHECGGTIRNNTIWGNWAGVQGGGLYSCEGMIHNNTICDNSAGEGGDGLAECTGEIKNCIIWGNGSISGNGGGEQLRECTWPDRCSAPTYSCIEGWRGGGEGNVPYFPRFVDPVRADYHLDSLSPCIDAGDPASPFSEEPEPNGGRVNMGSYGNTPEATPTPPDTDSDKLPDGWETEFFGDLDEGSNDDPDGDLLPNIREYHWNLDPAVPPTTWYVDGSVSVSGDGTSWEGAFNAIWRGTTAAAEHDVVVVAPGIYDAAGFGGKNIVLRSTNPFDAEVVANTIIDRRKLGSAVSFRGTEAETCVLAGFTIRNGGSEDSYGGGICGGTYDDYTHATIQNNVITNNLAKYGGGVAFCDGIIQNNTICDNTAETDGGGLFECGATVRNNVISRNSAKSFGGGLCWCGGLIENNTLFGNRAALGSAMAGCGGLIRNCIIAGKFGVSYFSSWWDWRWTKPSYCCIEGSGAAGEGNMAFEPYFVDAENGDFRLEPWSPCIDAGDPTSPFSNEPEPNGGRIDMGAYGNTPQATSRCSDADADGLPDGWEIKWFGSLAEDAAGDADEDRIFNVTEYRFGWDPTSPAEGRVVNVGKTTWYLTIQAAISDADEGDEIVAYPGVYMENVDFGGKNVVLRSTEPKNWAAVAETILDGGLNGSVVTFWGDEDETCVLSGFTVRNGMAEGGGGIHGQGCRAGIENNIITGNSSRGTEYIAGAGGGVYDCDGLIQNNVIRGNSAAYNGGGLCGCGGVIRNNVISDNAASSYGGGLCGCHGVIENNAIWRNKADYGGGVGNCGGVIRNNIISGNWARLDGGGLSSCDGTIENNTIVGNLAEAYSGLGYCRAKITNCIVWGNGPSGRDQFYYPFPPTYCCIEGWTAGGLGNISANPFFVDPDGADNEPKTHEDNDYRLARGSPCIDAGMNEDWMYGAVDLDGNPRVFFGRSSKTVDMGAYEYGSRLFSILKIVPSSGAGPEIVWESRVGETYVVWSCLDLLTGTWNEEATLPSQGEETTWTDEDVTPRLKFYRIEAR